MYIVFLACDLGIWTSASGMFTSSPFNSWWILASIMTSKHISVSSFVISHVYVHSGMPHKTTFCVLSPFIIKDSQQISKNLQSFREYCHSYFDVNTNSELGFSLWIFASFPFRSLCGLYLLDYILYFLFCASSLFSLTFPCVCVSDEFVLIHWIVFFQLQIL